MGNAVQDPENANGKKRNTSQYNSKTAYSRNAPPQHLGSTAGFRSFASWYTSPARPVFATASPVMRGVSQSAKKNRPRYHTRKVFFYYRAVQKRANRVVRAWYQARV